MPGAHDDVAARLGDVVAAAPGRLSAAIVTDDGWTWRHDADRAVLSASTIKVPILLATLRLVEHGSLDLNQTVRVPELRVGGSGPLLLLPSVTAVPLGELLALMIALSDNDATNAVLDLVGFGAVGNLLASVPTRHTVLARRMMDTAAAARGEHNLTSAADLVAIMVALRGGRLLDEEGTALALEILRTQQFREGLPGYLPESVTVASKTGELTGVRGDVALLETDGRWVAVAVLADGLDEGMAAGADRGTAVLPAFAELGELAAGLIGLPPTSPAG